MLIVRVLGAAAGGGFPQWNANSEPCRRARAGDAAAPAATQASVAVSADGRKWVIVNASPDLRQQIEASPCLQPQDGLRSSPIAAVLLTNGDVDAIAGLLHLREGTPFALYAAPSVLAILDDNPVFDVVDRGTVPRRPLETDAWQAIGLADGSPSGVEVRCFPVPGKVPLYLEGEGFDPATPSEAGETVGLEFRSGGARFFYVANCAAITPALAARLEGAPLVFFDGTLFTDDEMIRQSVGTKTGRRMGHMSLSGPDGSMAGLAGLGIGRVVFIHINNTNPILLKDSPERAAVEAAGFRVAHDGMEERL
ncbi:pyrroloquinoline quinone biosynthesis protein PqqB [Faunimonas sp. B44]|uniref:pyrroloquinoline quinone biosynthesis protein PqqB n=1 Tax=Faunimonas sp. B44 TaxID=3461493 RepID=UPI004044D198